MIYTASLVDYFPWVIWSCFFHYSVNCMNDTRNPLHVESTVETYNCKRGAITGMTNTTVYTNSTYNESESLVPIKPSKSLSYFTSWILIFIVKTLHVAYSCCLIYLYVYQYTCTLAQILLRFLEILMCFIHQSPNIAPVLFPLPT